MIIHIQPKSTWLPSKGEVIINAVEVWVGSYHLGDSALGCYDLIHVDEDGNRTSFGLTGENRLTPEQFASWGKDDDWFARCIVQNIGLFPTTNGS